MFGDDGETREISRCDGRARLVEIRLDEPRFVGCLNQETLRKQPDARFGLQVGRGYGATYVPKNPVADVIDRPKGYFPVPALKYLDGDYLDFVSDTLRGTKSRQRGIFNPDYVDHLLEDPDAHITPLNGSKLWQMAVLEHWLSVQGL